MSAGGIGQRSLFGMLTGAGSVIVKTGLNILLIPVLISQLGLDAFGLYILLIAIYEVAILLDLGAADALVTLLGSKTDSDLTRRDYLKVGNLLLGSLAILFLLAGLGIAPWFPTLFHIDTQLQAVAQTGFLLILVEAALTLYSCYSRSVLLARCAHQWSNLADVIYSLIANAGALIALLYGGDLVAVLALRLAGTLVRIVLMTVQTHRIDPYAFFPKTPFSLPAAKEVVRLSSHAMMINFSIIVSHKIDDIIIARFLPISAVGIYEIVFRFLGVIIQICLKINEGVYPLFTRLGALRQTDEARQLFLRMSCFLNFGACLMMVLIVSFYGELFLIFSAGKVPIDQTIPILLVAVPCVLSGVLQMPANALLFTWGQQRFLTVTSVLAALANLILSVILVQTLGIPGVALGTLIPQLIQHQWGLIGMSCRTLDISFTQYIKAVHGAILTPLAVSFLWIQLWRFTVDLSTFKLLPISLISLTAMLIGGFLWFKLTATPIERQLLKNLLANRFPSLNQSSSSSALTVDNV